MKPFKWIWKKVANIFKKFWNWLKKLFTGKLEGKGFWATIGRGFGKIVSKITESPMWKTISNTAAFKFMKRWAPKILAKVSSIGGKLLSVAGWILLIGDIKDATTTSACTVIAFENQGNPAAMPPMCDTPETKAYVKWALEKTGMGSEHADWDKDGSDEEEEVQGQEEAYTTSTVSMWTWEETPTTATPQVVYETHNPLVATETVSIG